MKEKEFVNSKRSGQAGRGTRMGPKYKNSIWICVETGPLLFPARIQESPLIDEILLVTGEQEIEYCRKEIVEKYGFQKVTHVIAGGKERYDSVYRGICALDGADYVYIHDGARPFIDDALLLRAKENVEQYHACAAGMPSKDTIKIVDKDGFVADTPQRSILG